MGERRLGDDRPHRGQHDHARGARARPLPRLRAAARRGTRELRARGRPVARDAPRRREAGRPPTPTTFTAATDPSTLNRTMGVNMLGMEGPDQQWIRAITEVPFRPRDVEERTQGMIPRLAGELLDGIVERGEADLFREYADPMSVRSLCFMLGLESVPWQDILRWNEGLMPGLANFEGDPAKQAPADEAARRPARRDRRRARPTRRRARRVGALVDAAPRGRRPTHEPRADRREHDADALRWAAGAPRRHRAHALGAAARTRSQLEQVRADRSLVKAAVEETLRWAGPVGTATRQTTRDVSLAGVDLEQGALIGAVLSSANRDPRRWTDPDTVRHPPQGRGASRLQRRHALLPGGVVRPAPRAGHPRPRARPPSRARPGPEQARHAGGMGVPRARSLWVRWQVDREGSRSHRVTRS